MNRRTEGWLGKEMTRGQVLRARREKGGMVCRGVGVGAIRRFEDDGGALRMGKNLNC